MISSLENMFFVPEIYWTVHNRFCLRGKKFIIRLINSTVELNKIILDS